MIEKIKRFIDKNFIISVVFFDQLRETSFTVTFLKEHISSLDSGNENNYFNSKIFTVINNTFSLFVINMNRKELTACLERFKDNKNQCNMEKMKTCLEISDVLRYGRIGEGTLIYIYIYIYIY